MLSQMTKRLLAALLCAVMLFTVSCTTPDSNKSETTDAPSDTEESTVPANGAKKVVTKTVKLYQTAERVDDVTVAHYEDTPDILLIDTETMCRAFIDVFLGTSWSFSYEETETTLTITRDNGAYCEIDFVEDTMYFDDFDMFVACGYGNMADMLKNLKGISAESVNYGTCIMPYAAFDGITVSGAN